jgi:amicyanin
MRLTTALVALATVVAPLGAQSLLYRSPNLSGTWVPDPGVVQFNFLHRFYVSPSPARGVSNYPTFTIAVGLPARTALGFHYATRSEIASTFTNEVEIFGRWKHAAGPVTLSITPAYNTAAKSFDGEIGFDWTRGPVTVLAAARAMAHAYRVDTMRFALAGGAVLRLNQFVGLTGDVASLLATRPGEKMAWSAGLVFLIPNSPHTFSLHASNVDVNTIQGSSRRSPLLAGFTSKPIYGFEFTMPLHLGRFGAWFGKTAGAAVTGDVDAPVAATLTIGAMKFPADTVVISAGQAVRWNNTDPLGHTIAFDTASGEASSDLIPPNGAYVHRFTRQGTYPYHCTPHPFMKGVVVVR